MSRQLIFIHGRAQENKDAVTLKKEWVDALKKGLEKNGKTLIIEDKDIRFPYYGQTLWDYTRGVSIEDAAKVVIKGYQAAVEAGTQTADRENPDLDSLDPEDIDPEIVEALDAARVRAGITDEQVLAEAGPAAQKGALNWPWVRALLKVLDRHPGLSGLSVALATRDVHLYLTDPNFRWKIDREVEKALSYSGEKVIVSHSLGTVVAYSILKDRSVEEKDIPLFVTLGSPLAVTSVRAELEPIKYPSSIKDWYNAMDERDVVALYPLEEPRFLTKPNVRNNKRVSNHTENRHGIAGYLDDKEIALEIYNALAAPAVSK